MEASRRTESRVIRLEDPPDAVELDTRQLLGRLEAQAEENGRLVEKAQAFERVARAERESRRRLSDTLKRERAAAEALHVRAEEAEAALAAQSEHVRGFEDALAAVEQEKQMTSMQLIALRG